MDAKEYLEKSRGERIKKLKFPSGLEIEVIFPSLSEMISQTKIIQILGEGKIMNGQMELDNEKKLLVGQELIKLVKLPEGLTLNDLFPPDYFFLWNEVQNFFNHQDFQIGSNNIVDSSSKQQE